MSTRYVVIPILAAMLLVPASAQTAADLFQKGIHAQETAGDLDGAIQIFRQVTTESRDRRLAAQAQYQLVLCMLQKGDRAEASKELDALARNFPEQSDLFARARKLIPGSAALLPAPWGESETSQLNIKRDGAFTGETLYYSVDPYYSDSGRSFNPTPPRRARPFDGSLRQRALPGAFCSTRTAPRCRRSVKPRCSRTTRWATRVRRLSAARQSTFSNRYS